MKRWSAVGVGVCLAASSLVLAVRHDGFNETKINLNDAGIWVTNSSLGAIGRVNTQIQTIEVRLNAPTAGSDVAQVDDTVVVVDEEKSQFSALDVGHAGLLDARKMPAGGAVLLGGPSGAVVDRESGRVWITPRDELANLDVKETKPTATTAKGVVAALGPDGALHVFSADNGTLYDIAPSGTIVEHEVEGSFSEPQITAVGSDAVVLDGTNGHLAVPARSPKVRTVDGTAPVLQQPGPARGGVLVATDDALLSLPIGGGSAEVIDGSGTGDAVAPVSLEGCDYGAWSRDPHYAFACDNGRALADEVPGVSDSPDLTFRVNRKRVLLNDRTTGANLLFTEDKPEPITDWDRAQNLDERDDKNEEQETRQLENKDCAEGSEAPVAKPDEVGTRPGRPVIVPVLDNDEVDKCDVAAVVVPTPLDPDVGTAVVVEDGTAIQVTPALDRQADVEFQYEVTGRAKDRSRATVTVRISTDDENGAPVAVADQTVVESGRSVTHNVLLNDTDPDGDALTLVSVTAPTGQVLYEANGKVQFTAPGGSSGTPRLRYIVEDERGEQAEGTLAVAIQPADRNVLPTVRPDRLVAFVGQEARIDLLANDTDPNGDRLQVTSVDVPASLQGTWEDDGSLRVTPKEVGSFQFGYQVLDDEGVVKGRVRIDVRPADGNTPPVAVRDDVIVRSGIPALVDLTANDLDLDGDVLAVTRIETDPDSHLAVELLEMRTARVTASAGISEAEVVRYWVTDGGDPVPGILVVRPFRQAGQDQSPLAVDDRATVRAGGVVAIRVLDNDRDPEGDRISLDPTAPETKLPDGQGLVFVQGDELRYRAPADATGTFTTFYVAKDPAGNRATGQVDIQVLPVDAPNRAPAPPTIEARVVTGKTVRIPIRLNGIDPDGDAVGLLGIDTAPSKGSAVIDSGGSISYTADLGATGFDQFTYLVKDSGGLPATGRVRLVVAPAPAENAPPVAVPDKIVLQPGEERAIPVLANDVDPDNDPLSLLTTGKDAPTLPRLAPAVKVDGDELVYTAPDSIDGPSTSDSFSYGVTDERAGSARGVVTVTIQEEEPANELPQARDDFVTPQLVGKEVTVDVRNNDFDPDDPEADLKVSLPDAVPGARVSGSKIVVRLEQRSLSFVYMVTDADGGQARAAVHIPVFETLPPITVADTFKVRAGASVSGNVLTNDTDPADKALRLVELIGIRGGNAKLLDESGRVEFTASDEVAGDAGFSYRVTNGTDTAVGSVVVEVQGQNFPPTFQRTSAVLPAGGERVVDLAKLVTDRNIDDEHSFSGAKSSSDKVKASLSGGQLTITSTDDARGTKATITLTVSDGSVDVEGTVAVEVTGHEGPPPQAVDDVAETTQGVAVTTNVTANDVDPLREGLTVEVQSVQGGAATARGDSIAFTPSASFFGVALVTYKITDISKEESRSSQATLRVTVFGFPGKPSAPSSTNAKPQSTIVSLQWGVPPNNGAPITGYVVKTDVGGKSQEFSGNKGDFTGLQNGTAYRFRVAARNKAVLNDGDLVWSDYSAPYTPNTVPKAPGVPTLKYGDHQITVSWSAPDNDGTAITKYTVAIGGGTSDQRDVGTATSYTWTGLTNGTAYTFRVRATNAAGDSEFGGWSSASDDNATPAGKPFAPKAVTAVRNDSDTSAGGNVLVSWQWQNTPDYDNGADATSFTVTADGGGSVPAFSFQVAATERSKLVSGLQNGTTYTFRVTATNKVGDGPAGNASGTPASVPKAPTALSASEGDRQAPLTYTPPNDGGATITKYEITSSQGSVGLTQGGGVSQGPTATATGLTNGTPYTFQLRACNEVGCGPWSNPSNSVTPFGDPAAPSVNVSVSDRTITWTWSAPDGNGRPIDHYEVRLDGGVIGTNYTSNSFARTFGYGESHTLSVIAVNTADRRSAAGTASASTVQPPRSVTMSKGSSAVGRVDGSGVTCTHASCAYLRVTLNNFGGGQHTVECWGNYAGTSRYQTYRTSANPSEVCWFGYPGYQAWVVVDGVESNHVTW